MVELKQEERLGEVLCDRDIVDELEWHNVLAADDEIEPLGDAVGGMVGESVARGEKDIVRLTLVVTERIRDMLGLGENEEDLVAMTGLM